MAGHKLQITTAVYVLCMITGTPASATDRARDLGIPFEGQPGALNSITDVAGIAVGHTTLISAKGSLQRGKGPIRTGVTVIQPRIDPVLEGVFAGWFTLNSSGEMTGTTWINERGILDGPIAITNTHSVGVVRDSLVAWMVDQGWDAAWHAPVVGETYDGALNDIDGQHVTREHVYQALESSRTGEIREGSVGGGTGMICNGFKGGIGTSSRTFTVAKEEFTLGALVQCNYNWDGQGLRLGGRFLADTLPTGRHCHTDQNIERTHAWYPYCESDNDALRANTRDGSIIVVLATDAPLMPHQLTRLAKRPSLALGRLGAISSDGSGDIFLAFSTANNGRIDEYDLGSVETYPNYHLSTIFGAAVEATEEAIINAMVAAETMTGADGLKIEALPKEIVRQIFASP
jgi:D-aminopeptidase